MSNQAPLPDSELSYHSERQLIKDAQSIHAFNNGLLKDNTSGKFKAADRYFILSLASPVKSNGSGYEYYDFEGGWLTDHPEFTDATLTLAAIRDQLKLKQQVLNATD